MWRVIICCGLSCGGGAILEMAGGSSCHVLIFQIIGLPCGLYLMCCFVALPWLAGDKLLAELIDLLV